MVPFSKHSIEFLSSLVIHFFISLSHKTKFFGVLFWRTFILLRVYTINCLRRLRDNFHSRCSLLYSASCFLL